MTGRILPTDKRVTEIQLKLRAVDGDTERQSNVALGLMLGALTNLAAHIEAHPETLEAAPDLAELVREGKAVIWAWDDLCGLGAAFRHRAVS